MTVISCNSVSLAFGVDTILDGISFSLNEGDKLGIVGVNGAGKSSLFRIITGQYQATEGEFFISKDKTLGMLDQNVRFEAEGELYEQMLTTFAPLILQEKQLEELRIQSESGNEDDVRRYSDAVEDFTAKGGYEFRGRIRGTLISLGFGEDMFGVKISSLSGGQKTRLALASLLIKAPDIMLLDEPTNHLDIDTLYWLEDFLRNYKKTVLVISHDRYFLDRITNKTLEIENRHGKLYNGNYTFYVKQKETDREAQAKKYELQQKEIARIEGIIEQQRRWGQEHNFVTIRAKEKQIEHMELVDKPENAPKSINFAFNSSGESGNDVLKIKNLSKSYGSHTLFDGFSTLIKKKEHVFIVGSNGCGKSTLMKIIAEQFLPDCGSLEYGYNVRVGYYDQENQQLNENNTVLDELWNSYSGMTQTEVRKALAVFLFRGDDILKKVSSLSGGEKARLTLAKLICSKMNLLLLDEPTNHLDINSREALENALLSFDGTIIAVSHDRYFINKLSDRILAFNAEKDGAIYDYHGNYEEFNAYKAAHLVSEAAGNVKSETDAKRDFIENKKQNAEARKKQRAIEKTQSEIEKCENRLDELARELEEVDGSDYKAVGAIYDEQQNTENALLELYEKMEELNSDL